jgi:hypothetical protein
MYSSRHRASRYTAKAIGSFSQSRSRSTAAVCLHSFSCSALTSFTAAWSRLWCNGASTGEYVARIATARTGSAASRMSADVANDGDGAGEGGNGASTSALYGCTARMGQGVSRAEAIHSDGLAGSLIASISASSAGLTPDDTCREKKTDALEVAPLARPCRSDCGPRLDVCRLLHSSASLTGSIIGSTKSRAGDVRGVSRELVRPRGDGTEAICRERPVLAKVRLSEIELKANATTTNPRTEAEVSGTYESKHQSAVVFLDNKATHHKDTQSVSKNTFAAFLRFVYIPANLSVHGV